MNTHDNTDLDSFDRALLTELRRVAAEGAPAPARRTRKRWAYAGSGIAAAAVAAFGFSTLGSPAAAAYAVDEQGDGDIVITIHELDDADGLERALAEHGIEAEVDYRADGNGPIEAPDAGEGEGPLLESSAGGQAEVEVNPGTEIDGIPEDLPCGDFDNMPFDTEMRADEYVITIPPDSALHDSDAVLRITTTGNLDDQVAGVQVAYSIGDVDCGFGTASLGVETN